MLIPSKEEIQKACEVFNQSKTLYKESNGKISKISMINKVFIEEFGPGFYKGSFIILKNHFRVLYFGHSDPIPLRVEECNPDGNYNELFEEFSRSGIYVPLHEFLWKFWPEGIYHIEKFLLDNG
jgi:hypothetical protein